MNYIFKYLITNQEDYENLLKKTINNNSLDMNFPSIYYYEPSDFTYGLLTENNIEYVFGCNQTSCDSFRIFKPENDDALKLKESGKNINKENLIKLTQDILNAKKGGSKRKSRRKNPKKKTRRHRRKSVHRRRH